MKKLFLCFFLFFLCALAGCANSRFLNRASEATKTLPTIESTSLEANKPIFYKDGQQAYYLKCNGPSWAECLELAGNACKNKGYDILEKNTVKIPSVIASDKIQNELYIACKVIEEVPKK